MKTCRHCEEKFNEQSEHAQEARLALNRYIDECPDCIDPTGRFAPPAAAKPAPPHQIAAFAPWSVNLPQVMECTVEKGAITRMFDHLEELIRRIPDVEVSREMMPWCNIYRLKIFKNHHLLGLYESMLRDDKLKFVLATA